MIECLICKKHFKYISNTHLKKHNLTCEDYKKMFPNCELKTEELKFEGGKSLRGKTYEQVYGVDISNSLKERKRDCTKAQMQDKQQIKIRKEKCAKNRNYDSWYNSIKKFFSNPDNIENRKIKTQKTLELKYVNSDLVTVKDKFIIGGRTSKAAFKFFNDFILKNNIKNTKCYFALGGKNNLEFKQYIKEHKLFVQYDFASYNNKDELDLIIEYNGPWHYTFEEMNNNPDLIPAPFFNSKTIKDIYEKDIIKLDHIKKKANKVYVYWEKYNKFVEYLNKDSFKIKNIINSEETHII